jgi:hypothetical protein
MGYRCKVCLTYEKDYTGEGWEQMGWQGRERCRECTDDDLALVATNPFVARMRERVGRMGEERSEMIRRFQKQALMRKHGQCGHCGYVSGLLASTAAALRDAHREKENAFEQMAQMLIDRMNP